MVCVCVCAECCGSDNRRDAGTRSVHYSSGDWWQDGGSENICEDRYVHFNKLWAPFGKRRKVTVEVI